MHLPQACVSYRRASLTGIYLSQACISHMRASLTGIYLSQTYISHRYVSLICQEWLRKQCLAATTKPRLISWPCDYACVAMYTHTMGLVLASNGTVITHVWQCTRMRWTGDGQCTRVLWRCGNSLFRQASRDHIDLDTHER